MKIKALEISEANSYIKKILNNDPILYNLRVRGEISNFKVNSSGHVYLTLKDETSKMKCIIFKNKYDKSLKLEDGIKIIATGYISVYERDGSYQLYINEIEREGVGKLHLEFEKLKQKLYKEGLFDEKYKKKIPYMPQKIGVVTSETGAVIRDIINVVKRRFPKVEILLYPVSVQGMNSAEEIVKGIEFFNEVKKVDTMIVGRGGGSLEELWSFNEEKVARAIFASDIPIISAVGHEVDFTICDFVSDMRAPTPSAAAEIAVPNIDDLLYRLDNCKKRLKTDMYTFIDRDRNKLENTFNEINSIIKNNIVKEGKNNLKLLSNRLSKSIESKIEKEKYQLVSISDSIKNNVNQNIDKKKEQLKNSASLLHSLSPLATIDRGYCMVQKEGCIINSIEDVNIDENLKIMMIDGNIECKVNSIENKQF
ncbi:exodeoxyribonuclease VII large subunit [Peptacetobacter sp.]|uniref:exodeoxyribonuclease VII large subunit n=1 Tax=Peptacetobacter sp. TaxID=2991975 RepID=UPI00263100AC|nr:exodeoxyribonuclease VII large subunit [Peptacetobacter sp.]